MRNLFTVTIAFLSYLNGYCQTDLLNTEIIIIGTIHSGNKYINHKTLYKLLESLNPDIILDEDSQKYKPVFGLKTATFLKIVKPSIEQQALQKILKRNRNSIVLPYDTSFAIQQQNKNQKRREYIARKKWVKNAEAVRQSFHDNLYNVKKTILDSTIYADFVKKHNFYYSFFDSSTLSRLNQKDMIDMSRELKNKEESVILPLGKKYLSDSLLVNNFLNEIQFWNERNDYMVKQILYYSKQFEGKKIVILTGLNHKYYLQDKIRDSKKSNINIVELVNE
ncbi:MAG: hypothetical protein C0446_13725 [Chitinophaga sp.]|nr:hypothetical protein [Chitinophaga sp.]